MWEFWRGKLSKGRTSPRSTVNAGSPRNPDRRAPAVVNFKDLNLSVDDELSEDVQHESAYHEDEDPTNKAAIIQRSKALRSGAQKNKLIIIMVGLPGRGKTFLCNKLKCYLNWLGHNTAHFNVGNYRRLQKEANEVQDASFFDSHNKHGVEARTRALAAAVNDVMQFLTEGGQVAIFDATNTTKERRQQLVNTFHGRCQYIFIESICNDDQVLENNYRYKMKYSPDYVNVDTEAAIADFKQRILKYNEVYEPIDDRRLHYIKLIDMVTGRGYMDVNRISGYIPGKIVFFLMQVCKAGMTAGQSRKIWLTRHGESCFNMAGRIGGDSGLTARGEEYARLLPDVLESRLPATFNESGVPVSVWTSTLKRTIATANYLPYPKLRWKALDEIHAGVCDGMTYPEIAQKFPEDYEARKKDKLRYRYPSGESYLDVIQRLEPVIIEMEREREYIMVVGHQAILRAIFGYFMAIPLEKIPRLDIPLHTLIELQPRPDGTMEVSFLPVPVSPPHGNAGPSVRQPTHTGFLANPPVQLPLGTTCSDAAAAAAAAAAGAAGAGLGRGSSGYPSHLNIGTPPSGVLPSFGSLPAGFYYPGCEGGGSSNRGSRERDRSAAGAAGGGSSSSSGWQNIVAAAAGHRRTSSASAMTYPRGFGNAVHLSPSFATVSSMASLASNSSSHGSGLAGLAGGGSSSSGRSPAGLGSLSASGSAVGLAGNNNGNGDAAAAAAAAGACELDVSRLQHALGQQYAAIIQGSSGSSSSPAKAAASGGSSSGADAAAAAELQLQGLALSESVALTSGASMDTLAAAAVAAAAQTSSSSIEAGGLSIALQQQHSGGGSSVSSGGSDSSSPRPPSPVLAAALGSMNSLD